MILANVARQFKRHRALSLILLLALAARVVVAFWLGDTMEVLPAGGTHDQVSYDMLAQRVATGHGFTFPTQWYPWIKPDTPTSYYSGTMVLHLAAIYWLFGYHPLIARLVYAVLGTFIVYMIYRLGRRLFGVQAGLIAAGLAAGYAYLVLYSATLLTETPFILCLLLAFELAFRTLENDTIKNWVLFGLALAGTVLFRMAVLPALVFLLGWLYLKRKTISRRWHFLIPIVIVVGCILPWTIRNVTLFGRFMLLESQFGHVFWVGNHPARDATFGEVAWVPPIPNEIADLNEADLTYELLHRGIQNVLNDPGRFILLTLSRTEIFFTFWPTPGSSSISNIARVLSFGILLPFMLYGLVIAIKQCKMCLPLYVFVVLHTGVYVASWVMIRYRIPVDTILLLFAGLAISRISQRFKRAKPALPKLDRPMGASEGN
jgi:4-amino-4-deoxy-L-arabinose transferase-like glycosyltransferase